MIYYFNSKIFKSKKLGDSGGPVFIYDTQLKKYVLIGITSYGDGCGNVGRPG